MNPRITFLNACNEIANSISEFGFKPIQKGQILKKVSMDKDVYFELYFQSSHLNNTSSVIVWPHIRIYSKQLKKWSMAQTKNEYADGLIYTNQIGYITPRKKWRDWDLADLSYTQSISEIIDLIKNMSFQLLKFLIVSHNQSNS